MRGNEEATSLEQARSPFPDNPGQAVKGILAIIGARGGSKSLPKKNVASLCGKPLIAWTIEAAGQSGAVTRTVVSTDDAEIADVARRYGADVPFLRPPELAGDTAPSIAAVLHAVRWLGEHEDYHPDVVVYLQPTSPLRTAGDIDAAVALLDERKADAVVSVCPAQHHPFWMKTVDSAGWLRDFVEQAEPTANRQELPLVYSLNGAIYMARRETLLSASGWYTGRTAAYVMPVERSVDIDTAWDFVLARLLLERSG